MFQFELNLLKFVKLAKCQIEDCSFQFELKLCKLVEAMKPQFEDQAFQFELICFKHSNLQIRTLVTLSMSCLEAFSY